MFAHLETAAGERLRGKDEGDLALALALCQPLWMKPSFSTIQGRQFLHAGVPQGIRPYQGVPEQ